MISGKRVIAAMLTALMAVTFTANTAVSVYATGVTATENAQTIDAQSTDAQALTPEEQKAQELQQVYDMPVESNGYKDWPQGPGTYGEAGIVMEVGTGAILYAKNIDAHEYPASITKVLTALVALENGQLTDNVTFSHDSVAFLQRGDSSVGLKEGNVITLDQAMHAMLLASANEAAYAIGESVGVNAGHDYNWFIEQMNSRCKELGGENSNFANTNGLHDPNHYTCARDMALIGRELFKHSEFFQIVQTLNYTIPASETTEEHVFHQKHKMLQPSNSNYYPYTIGGKTGYTSDALSTLITMADNGQTQLVCVVLRTHGKNIYPEEIEGLLGKVPEIQECMVYGKEVAGEKELIITARVIPNMEEIESSHGEGLGEDEIYKILWEKIKQVNRKLSNYKTVKKLEIKTDQFEKTSTLKIKRYAELAKDKKEEK